MTIIRQIKKITACLFILLTGAATGLFSEIITDQTFGFSLDIPEGYELAEVIGDLAGNAAEDREILIMCRKLPALYTLTLTFTEEETGLALTEPLIYPDLEGAAKDGLTTSELIEAKMNENIRIVNEEMPNYSKISSVKIMPEEFEKTPKRSIKRYIYQK